MNVPNDDNTPLPQPQEIATMLSTLTTTKQQLISLFGDDNNGANMNPNEPFPLVASKQQQLITIQSTLFQSLLQQIDFTHALQRHHIHNNHNCNSKRIKHYCNRNKCHFNRKGFRFKKRGLHYKHNKINLNWKNNALNSNNNPSMGS